MPPTTLSWAETAADTARHRLEQMTAELDAALRVLEAAGRATDWQSPAADAFHGELGRLRADVVRLRHRAAELATTATGARVLLAAQEGQL